MAYRLGDEWHGSMWWSKRSPEVRLSNAGIPRRYVCELPDFVDQKHVDKAVHKWLDDHMGQQGIGLWLMGPGAGHLAAALLHHVLLKPTNVVSAYFTSATRLQEMSFDSMDNDGELSDAFDHPHLIRLMRKHFHLLVINHLGLESPSEHVAKFVRGVIQDRWDEMRPTIVVSDDYSITNPAALHKRYGNSAMFDPEYFAEIKDIEVPRGR